jgi:hypothetical protein
MIPLKDLDTQKGFADLAAPGGKFDHVSISCNAGHPGVPDRHYHIVLWHISKAQEQLVAKWAVAPLSTSRSAGPPPNEQAIITSRTPRAWGLF